jgi:hypothetical protein
MVRNHSKDIYPEDIVWDDIIKKEAKGIDNVTLGEVQEIAPQYIITVKGTLDKDKFLFPKDLVERFDGVIIWIRVTKEEANEYRRE